MKTFNYELDKITGVHHPALYPGEKPDKWSLPDDIRTDYSKLNSIIETKYTREFLKICAFYNKMFPSLKTSNWVRTSYNVQPFTILDQERSDTGTGISCNYLKQIIDQVVARIGTVSFEPSLLSDVPTLEYIIYKDEVERLLRKVIRDEELSRMTMEIFHDAAVLGYAHCIIDPVTQKPFKANDYEVGLFESQFSRNELRQVLFRDYAFPVTSLVPYLATTSAGVRNKIVEEYGKNTTVDFKIYFDCPERKVYITINSTTLDPVDYPFDTVQMTTFSWDLGFNKVTSTSLFDLLYPCQRELNKINAKIQQLIRIYKGPVPEFNADVDLAMKAITNGTGEALFVDSARPVSDLMTVINPTPLDSAMSAEVTNYKTMMFELAGIQQVSFDLENMRSAAAVIALDQTRDTVFQAQLDGIAGFVKRLFRLIVNFNAVARPEDTATEVAWPKVKALLESAAIELKPVHVNDPLGNKNTGKDAVVPDYRQIQTARAVVKIMDGELTYEDATFMLDKRQVTMICAATIVKLDALGIDVPESLVDFIIAAFLESVQRGEIKLIEPLEPIAPGADVGNG
jgi:hypothetical protein